MRDTEFAELVTLAIESLKKEIVHYLLQSNADYQRECEVEGDAEQQYIQLEFPEKWEIEKVQKVFYTK